MFYLQWSTVLRSGLFWQPPPSLSRGELCSCESNTHLRPVCLSSRAVPLKSFSVLKWLHALNCIIWFIRRNGKFIWCTYLNPKILLKMWGRWMHVWLPLESGMKEVMLRTVLALQVTHAGDWIHAILNVPSLLTSEIMFVADWTLLHSSER